MYNDFTKYLSAQRNETIVKVSKSDIIYPQTLIDLQTAFDSILKEFQKGKYVFVAAGILEGNENKEEANLFNTVFGRDGLIMLDFYQSIKHTNKLIVPDNLARSTLEFMASYQGVEHSQASEEELGKIFHEYRDYNDPIAVELAKSRGWAFPYYGGVDTTFHYIKQLSHHLITHPEDKNYNILNHKNSVNYTFEESLMLAYEYTKSTIKGNLVQYHRLNSGGIEIQSWRDSYDSISNHEGELPSFEKDLALLDLQMIALEAYESIKLVMPITKHKEIDILIAKLKQGLELMWVPMEKGGFYGSGIQEDKIFDTVTSTNLILLQSDFITDEHKKAIFDHCYPLLNVTNGIATLGTNENRYHISGYHTGNVWLFDNVLCYQGLISSGYDIEAAQLKSKIINIISQTNCYPELVGSTDVPNQYMIDVLDNDSSRYNRVCQPGQPLQGWTIMAIASLLS